MTSKNLLLGALMLLLTTGMAWTQSTGPELGLSAGFGVQSFNDGPDGEEVSYQKIGLTPELALGNWALAFDVSLHIKPEGENPFTVRKADWVPEDSSGASWLQLYLSKFVYVRYGQKGDDLFFKLGSLNRSSLGTGLIMDGYSNMLFLPDQRLLGGEFQLDGRLLDFPYLGVEAMAGNLAAWDVMAMRLYSRPLYTLDLGLFRALEIGLTLAGDANPDQHGKYFAPVPYDVEPVFMYGLDAIQPLLSNNLVSLAAYVSMAAQPGSGDNSDTATGAILGVGGRLIKIVPYRLQLRMMGDNFIPSYFDRTYDVYRAEKYAVVSGNAPGYEGAVGWLGSLGVSLLQDMIIFDASLDGPFSAVPSRDANNKFNYSSALYPHLAMNLAVKEGIVPGIFLDAYYDKKYITGIGDTFHPEGAVIGANVNYRAGSTILTLGYGFVYNPETDDFDTTAKLMVSAGLF